jgi:hypothetical protein
MCIAFAPLERGNIDVLLFAECLQVCKGLMKSLSIPIVQHLYCDLTRY